MVKLADLQAMGGARAFQVLVAEMGAASAGKAVDALEVLHFFLSTCTSVSALH